MQRQFMSAHTLTAVALLAILWLAACAAMPEPQAASINQPATASPLTTRTAPTIALPFATGTATGRAPATATATAVAALPAEAKPLPTATAVATVDTLLTSVAQLFPTATATPSPTFPAVIFAGERKIILTPGAPQPYFQQFRLVSYYGHPNSAELGILGQRPRGNMVEQLRRVAGEYQALLPGHTVLPALHFIATVADVEPGPGALYRQQTPLQLISEWIEYAHGEEMAFIIDIQPGHADLEEEVQRIRHFLYHPHVHLAIDPEFMMTAGEIPGVDLGHIRAGHINAVQAELDQIARTIGLNKVLIIHQFETSMVRDKELITAYPFVELVLNADGFGPPDSKIADLHQYAAEPGWQYAGFKLFYEWDVPLLTPVEVMRIEPQPVLVVYQ
jgi:hypothetical protein